VDVVLRTARLTAIEHYDPGDLTIGVGAGMSIAALESKLAQHGQLLPLESHRPEAATIGGSLAVAAHGPLKHGYGGVRDFCIGVHFVTSDGKIAKGGGRVVKNVAGYDLMKLMIGSYGTLGVIVSANFKLFPAPRQTRTFVLKFLLANGAIQFRNRLLRSPLTPMCMELVSPRAAEVLRDRLAADNTWQLLLRAAGSDAVLSRYRNELGNYVKEELDGEPEAAAWRAIADFESEIAARYGNAMLIEVSVPVDWAAETINAAERVAAEHEFICAVVGRVGVGSLLVAYVPVTPDVPAAMQYANAVSAFRACLPRDASVVVTRCPRDAKVHFSVWGSTPNDLETMRAIKRALDPAGILNRGRFLV
jgi:glycolate oxidase FAD binding subunit